MGISKIYKGNLPYIPGGGFYDIPTVRSIQLNTIELQGYTHVEFNKVRSIKFAKYVFGTGLKYLYFKL